MALFSKTQHHLHVRKRVHLKLEEYPHPDKLKNFLDKIIYVVGVLGPIMTLPQLFKIWVEKDASGVSLFSWSGYLMTASIWLVYAIVHKEKPLIITYISWIIVEVFLIIGIVIYN